MNIIETMIDEYDNKVDLNIINTDIMLLETELLIRENDIITESLLEAADTSKVKEKFKKWWDKIKEFILKIWSKLEASILWVIKLIAKLVIKKDKPKATKTTTSSTTSGGTSTEKGSSSSKGTSNESGSSSSKGSSSNTLSGKIDPIESAIFNLNNDLGLLLSDIEKRLVAESKVSTSLLNNIGGLSVSMIAKGDTDFYSIRDIQFMSLSDRIDTFKSNMIPEFNISEANKSKMSGLSSRFNALNITYNTLKIKFKDASKKLLVEVETLNNDYKLNKVEAVLLQRSKQINVLQKSIFVNIGDIAKIENIIK